MSLLVIFVNSITNALLAIFKINPTNNQGDELSPEELRTVVYEAGSLIPKEHQDMLVSILELEKMTAEDIMIPRNEVSGLNLEDNIDILMEQIIKFRTTITRLKLNKG